MNQKHVSRRTFVNSAALAGIGLAAPASAQFADEPLPALARPSSPPEVVAADEAYWRRVAARYRISDRVTNLEAGYWGMMAAPGERSGDGVGLRAGARGRRPLPGGPTWICLAVP